MVDQYTYDDIVFTDADPSRVVSKKKETNPRKPLPAALTDALRESYSEMHNEDASLSVRAVKVPGTEKAARNLVHRMRAWVTKNLGATLSVKADVAAGEPTQGNDTADVWVVTFRVVSKRQSGRKTTGEQLTINDMPTEDVTSEEAPARAKRSRK